MTFKDYCPSKGLPRDPLHGPALWLARGSWIFLVLYSLGLFIIAVPYHIVELSTRLEPATRIALLQIGMSVEAYVVYQLLFNIVIVVGFTLTGVIIFFYKSDDWMTLFVSLALITFGVAITPTLQSSSVLYSLATRSSGFTFPAFSVYTIGLGLILLVFYLFPDGKFVPYWTRPMAIVWAIWIVAFLVFPGSRVGAPVTPARWMFFWGRLLNIDAAVFATLITTLQYYTLALILIFWFGSGAFAQIYRYVLVSNAAQRHQSKWVVFGFTAAVGIYFGLQVPTLIMLTQGATAVDMMRYQLIITPLCTLALLLFPLSLSISMLRFRLWDVDFIINRTLVYGGLTSLLGMLYFGSVLLAQAIFSHIAGYESAVVIALVTLLISALFRPLRGRLQYTIDRRFYREKVNFRQVFTDFAREVRTIIELPELLEVLVQRTRKLLHAEYGAVYLRSTDQPLILVHGEALPQGNFTELSIADKSMERLKEGQVVSLPLDQLYPMLVPLIAPRASQQPDTGNRLVGVLALGPLLSGLHYNREDQNLLMSLADQAGTAIFVAQLIQESQEEVRRREEAEERLETYRHSPAGQAEAMAKELLEQPHTAFHRLYDLAQLADRDAAAASLLNNLPKILESSNAAPLAVLAEGFNYLVASQYTPELLPVGLRTLAAVLDRKEITANNNGGERGGRSDTRPPFRREITGQFLPEECCQSDLLVGIESHAQAAQALTVYCLCLAALDANSISQVTALHPDLNVIVAQSIDGAILGDLETMLEKLLPAVEALHAFERVDTAQDKLAYLVSAVDRLRHVERLARADLSGVDRSTVERIVESWLALITSAMGELQASARMLCRLLTRNTWQGDVVSLALSIMNQGRGAALQIRITLAPGDEYTLLDDHAMIDRLAPGEEAQVQLRVRPRLASGADHFRARFVVLYTDPRGPDQVENFADVVHLMAEAGEFQFIPNPYVVGTPLQTGSPLFFGREDLVAFVQQNLAASHRNNLVLIGQRRTGKTSLLKQLPARLDDNYLPVYLDGQTLGLDPGLPNFFLNLATEISFAMEDRGYLISPPELEEFQNSPAATFERVFLERVRELIGDRHLLIMFDEFEELEAAVQRKSLDSSIFGFLRHLIQHSKNLSVIFCGTHRIEELASDYWSILFNISLYQHIAFLEKEEAMRLVQEPVAKYGMRYDDLALDKMWRVTAGHPYFLQLLCHSLVNRHNKAGRSYVTIADVNCALDEILAAGEAHFVYMWTESTHQERLALTALSRMVAITGQVTAVQVTDFLTERGISVDRQAISEALHHLTLRDILRAGQESEASIGETYHWKLGLLGLWVEKYKSLSRVVDEVVEPKKIPVPQQ